VGSEGDRWGPRVRRWREREDRGRGERREGWGGVGESDIKGRWQGRVAALGLVGSCTLPSPPVGCVKDAWSRASGGGVAVAAVAVYRRGSGGSLAWLRAWIWVATLVGVFVAAKITASDGLKHRRTDLDSETGSCQTGDADWLSASFGPFYSYCV
jgi:hypothetical protein